MSTGGDAAEIVRIAKLALSDVLQGACALALADAIFGQHALPLAASTADQQHDMPGASFLRMAADLDKYRVDPSDDVAPAREAFIERFLQVFSLPEFEPAVTREAALALFRCRYDDRFNPEIRSRWRNRAEFARRLGVEGKSLMRTALTAGDPYLAAYFAREFSSLAIFVSEKPKGRERRNEAVSSNDQTRRILDALERAYRARCISGGRPDLAGRLFASGDGPQSGKPWTASPGRAWMIATLPEVQVNGRRLRDYAVTPDSLRRALNDRDRRAG